jgi:hypothetical protein
VVTEVKKVLTSLLVCIPLWVGLCAAGSALVVGCMWWFDYLPQALARMATAHDVSVAVFILITGCIVGTILGVATALNMAFDNAAE